MAKTAKIYTVSQINSLVKGALEEKMPPRLVVRGEISDWKHHTSGHCYFSLKDEGGVLPCVMWSSSFKKVKFSPDDGMAVLATGHIDVYTVGGKYQLYVDKLDPAGMGALQLAFDQMVRKLREEGLFDEEHKKPLPSYPMRIGVLTSESGAALHDITDSIGNRWPCATLFLYPVPVQGEDAAKKIAAALRDVNKRNKKLELDVLIVGRGGGSLEDLWAFNEEVLARAIFNSKIPVISAVGHEVDTTIADLVADARASTPTKAGVVAVPDVRDIRNQLIAMEQNLKNQLIARVQHAEQEIRIILAGAVFRNPLSLVRNAEQQVDELATDLAEAIKERLAEARQRVSDGYERVVRVEPHRLLGRKMVELNDWQNRADKAMRVILNNCRMQLTAIEQNLSNQTKTRLQLAQQDLQIILAEALFRTPFTLVQNVEKRLDKLATDLTDVTRKLLSEAQRKVSAGYEQIVRIEPHRLLGRKMVELNVWKSRTEAGMSAILNNCQMQLTAKENRLSALNPKSILHRGYSITTNKKTGSPVRTPEDVQMGDDLLTELVGENFIESMVTRK